MEKLLSRDIGTLEGLTQPRLATATLHRSSGQTQVPTHFFPARAIALTSTGALGAGSILTFAPPLLAHAGHAQDSHDDDLRGHDSPEANSAAAAPEPPAVSQTASDSHPPASSSSPIEPSAVEATAAVAVTGGPESGLPAKMPWGLGESLLGLIIAGLFLLTLLRRRLQA